MKTLSRWISDNVDTLLIVGACFVMVFSLVTVSGVLTPADNAKKQGTGYALKAGTEPMRSVDGEAAADEALSRTPDEMGGSGEGVRSDEEDTSNEESADGGGNAGSTPGGNRAGETAGTLSNLKITDWGLSFGQSGMAPRGNVDQKDLSAYNAYFIDDRWSDAAPTGDGNDGTTQKQEMPIYLTFDAGYENGYTGKILDVLKSQNVKAAFFLVGSYIDENPELVKRMAAEGHLVCNHTMHHPNMSKIIDKEAFSAELRDLESVCKNAAGVEMAKFYRPPQGKFCEENLENAKELGYSTIFWSLAYVDWLEDKQPTREQALAKLNERIHPGAVVLLHSTSKTNSVILEDLIMQWKERGFSFRTLDELVKQ